MQNGKKRVHDWRLLKWPFTATFAYYALLMLFTGSVEGGAEDFFGMLGLAVVLDAALYFFYCFFLSRGRDDINKLWAVFILFYGLLSIPQLQALWELMKARAVT